jgi:hypothetical protein
MKFFKRLYRAFFPEYILHVTHRGDERHIHVKDFKKLSPKRIKGVTKSNQEFDMVSNEPMDYYIIEYREDLK